MKIAKWIGVAFIVYVGIVVAFETLLALVQPTAQNTIVIAITDDEGTTHDRVVSYLESNGQVYVAANHWPRAWYSDALENPSVRVTRNGEERAYVAVPVSGAERDRVNTENPLGFIRFLTGFPPRAFLRLDPG